MLNSAKEIKFRASGVGNLFSASGEWTLTNKKHLAAVYVKYKYGRDKKLENKYINKGLAVEDDSITLYSKFKRKMFVKNEQFFENSYLTGTPDIITDDCIIDIKSSYNIHTFFESIGKLNELYYWQMQAYMALTGKQHAKLAYCLTDMPEVMLQGDLYRLMFKMGCATDQDELYLEAAEAYRHEHTYGDIPLEERIIEIDIPRNQADIMRMYQRVIEGRQIIDDTLIFKTAA